MSVQAIVNDGNVVFKPKSDGVVSSQSALLHRNIKEEPRTVTSAQGNYLTLDNGQRIFDATGGAAVACLGHGNGRVKRAIAAQMDEVSYCHSLFFGSRSGEEFARYLIDSTKGRMSKAFIVSSGSEAMEAAIKLCRQYFLELSPPQPQRVRFIARKESYHGTTLGALSMSGHLARRRLFQPILIPTNHFSHVSACNSYRGMKEGESFSAYVTRLAEELDAEFQRVGPDSVCAFVAEPVVGAALGCVPAVPGYFPAMKKVCDKYGALLVFDEVMCGMGRSGTMHAWEQEGVVPDVQTIGKGLGGGYVAVAGVLVGPKVVRALEKGTGAFAHGQTYQGHPVACAAGLEVQRIIGEEHLVENVARRGAYLERLLKERLADHPHVGDIRGNGLFWGIEFVKDKATKKAFDPELGVAMAVHNRGMHPDYGISLYPGTGTVDGKVGDHVLIAPAYTVTEADVELIVDLAARVVEDVLEEFGDSTLVDGVGS